VHIFIGLLLLFVCIIVFRTFKKKNKKTEAYSKLELISSWLSTTGATPSEATFTVYDDVSLMESDGDCIIVGTADLPNSEFIGFYAELKGKSLISHYLFNPPGVATWHRLEAASAKRQGISLLKSLKSREVSADDNEI
jgi:hypothetical protein